MNGISTRNKFARFLIYAILICTVISILYPFGFMLLNSFKTKSEYYSNIFGWPRGFYTQNYAIALERFDVLRLGSNSLAVTVCSLLINVTVCSMASYGFTKLPFRFSGQLLALIIACMMIPGQVLMIPVYLIMSKLGLVNHFASATLFYVATSIPFGTFMMTSQCRNIPGEVIEAAEIDGAGPARIFGSVIVPLLRPSITTLAVLNFLTFWNELLYAMLFLQSQSTRTLTVEIATSIGRYASNMPLLVTGLLINSIPTVLVFIFCQKQISRGMLVGAVK